MGKGKLKYRRQAAVVGYLDVIFALLHIIIVAVSGVFIFIAYSKQQAALRKTGRPVPEEDASLPSNATIPFDPKSPLNGYFLASLNVIWTSVGLAAAFSFTQLVNAVRMLKATEATYDPKEAVSPTRIWFFFNLVLVLVMAPLCVLIFGPFGAVGWIAILPVRLVMIWIVYRFMQEVTLSTALTTSKWQNRNHTKN